MREQEDRRLDVGSFIREQRLLGRVSLRGLSEAAGISNPYLSQIERGLRRPSAEILRQIAQALQISAETLYVHAGILDEPTGEVDVVATINRDRHLDGDQKRALVHIYQSFRAQHAAGAAEPEPGSDLDLDLGPDPHLDLDPGLEPAPASEGDAVVGSPAIDPELAAEA